MQAVLMAGGKGTRLWAVTDNKIPKPLVPFCGKTLIERLVETLVANRITQIVICVGYLGEQIVNLLSDGSRYGAKISYVREEAPLGTAGALYYAKEFIDSDFLLLNADLVADVDFERMLAFHRQKQAIATLFVHPNSHPYDSDIVLKDEHDRVLQFDFKENKRDCDYENCTNAGVVIFAPEVLERFTAPKKLALEKDVIAALLAEGKPVYAYASPEYVMDVGTPDRLESAQKAFESGRVAAGNLSHTQKAIFLDRDGTLNVFKGLITKPEQIELIAGVPEALAAMNASDYLALVVTNQPVIARGDCSKEMLALIHKRLYTLLGNAGCYVDDLIYCPHHPDSGYEGEVKELKVDCDCRKPKTGMIEVLVKKYHIDLSRSFFIGDTYRDVQTGANAGVKTILIPSGADVERERFNARADYVVKSLPEALALMGIRFNPEGME
ncbi:MAG: HAD-IIIA family hydrolase [Ruminococcaceae bacterium]|nr:HAD-IIIA family hydrolase [Oscillospiraceae bacterium]